MQIVHYGHSCVLLDTGAARLLFDPGTFSSGFEDLTDLDAVLVTHQHADHLDPERLPALLDANPGARLVADPGSARELADGGITATVARAGDALDLSGVAVSVIGADHEVVHPDLPVVDNVGYLVEHGAFYHPGDSLHVPEQQVDVLALPTAAPWMRAADAVDFLRAVAPRAAVPVHQELLAVKDLYYSLFERLAPKGTVVAPLTPGEPTRV
ncbi:MBL fold metallo-hydrolase [Umezawaea beigongshangensis]|uniref:MBL fold metallo-hydrolase n=1 Tax=Umezawaea beigongshangensis TaxID=2780383 RepID=UPI0018F1D244|nr:MBL fold metallo-hydrolase [Umezawaea beigongshangensis]